MDSLIPVINDLSVIIFDLLIFTRMISLKKDTMLSKCIMYIGCTLIVLAYFTAAYVYEMPPSISSAVFMSIPSLILFFLLSRHKDCRFFMTFCFVDSVSLIVAFVGRYISLLTSNTVGVASIVVTVATFITILYIGRDYFNRYHMLLEVVSTGWGEMTVSMALIYFALVFFAAYPEPLVNRLEYAPVYLVFSLVVLSCYLVFIRSIIKTRQIYVQNKQLEHEKRIFHIAYWDVLTGLMNRAAYIECVNKLERERESDKNPRNTVCLMFDLNDLKRINDTMGHHMGDIALKYAADGLKLANANKEAYLFRLGGDEFCALLPDSSQDEAAAYMEAVREEMKKQSAKSGLSLCLAAGSAMVENEGDDTIEKAFMRADKKMYEDKKRLKNDQ
ncbi:GGDEF domain-containing protein [Clostridium sp. AM58-1XD]|uniref:GGDEF domain-containing protein n=1 Tax=Clostridium sp. AM58-1XD TaxID=2292307 RepID=UPI000E52C4CC|nr:GGDEF domain-containing protein [Clostridium sp. AM58-1XD]RGZ00975.1 GGDEF domain-containing protein [Clostridium sp. AM58-1XD]